MKVSKIVDDAPALPLCCAMLSLETRKYWSGRGRCGNDSGSDSCGNYAKYLIDDKYFCGKHAGTYVLKELTK